MARGFPLTAKKASAIALAALCVSMSGCLGGFLIGLSQGGSEAIEKAYCDNALSTGVAVSSLGGDEVPADQGEVRYFAPAGWERPGDRARTLGRLAVTERSVFLVPHAGNRGVLIPLALISRSWIDVATIAGSPRRIVVDLRCVEGRHEFVIFADGAPPTLDPTAMREARERIEAMRKRTQ
jgi:hypothetical protein